MFGHTYKRYEIRAELGSGGMATVYRAYDPSFEREVALKVLKRELLEDPALRERFERETKIIARLEHAAIVPVYDVDFDNHQLFYVMRYMHGGTLVERIENQSLDLEQISYILLRLADALDYAHRKGVVHRDLKPANILFDERDNAFISDFGIAKFIQASSTRLTHSGIIGTPRYMSPEQASGDEVDGRSDQYSLGVIMFEMLSGQAPFEADTPLLMALKHATEPAPNIVEIKPDLPPEIGDVFRKILEKKPEDRFATVAEFANRFLEALPPSILPLSKIVTPIPPRPPQKDAIPTSIKPPASIPAAPTSGSRRWLVGGILTLAILGLLFFGYSRFHQMPASPPAPGTVTATTAPSSTPTQPPPTATVTDTPVPTASPEPTATVFVDPGIGGATHIALVTNYTVYLMDIHGGNRMQIPNTNTRLPKFDLQWLPDGKTLLYGEQSSVENKKCIFTVNVDSSDPQPEKLGCLTGDNFTGFRVSPDGKYVAISIKDRLLVLPFDREFLSADRDVFELQNWDQTCIKYSENAVSVRGAQWSSDGRSLAIKYQGLINNRLGDSIRILSVDLSHCQSVTPDTIDEFPGKRFTLEEYTKGPTLPSYNWDGDQRFLFNTLIRNQGYGNLYLYNRSSRQATLLNPMKSCCYRGATFSPDGTYMLFLYQDRRLGADGETSLYYMPVDGSTAPALITVPLDFFINVHEDTLFALQPAAP